ncbi:enoyl-[acyl-carrier-protein] reductase [nadh] chloroplastic [Phtheirospermum japonicum]|uniref:Enoyl-[acyl-carrier-protein] reductase [nadh] chloroplastic n=1 Tax=Phtheirospermum japonicum TaxID=374723 RepID=A0A830DIL3_9LAMI|nr:enoyl-[acyl-carrier-protein] reductase [nadh] chloroplastic [Phtheirospermum japonicum]
MEITKVYHLDAVFDCPKDVPDDKVAETVKQNFGTVDILVHSPANGPELAAGWPRGIHPDCALLPNAIVIDEHHPHPLLLTYFDTSVISASICAICDHRYEESDGLRVYACFHCRYSAHIKCTVYSDPGHTSFKPVLIRDAQVPGLLRLPMPNENTSVMSCILMESTGVTNVGGASTTSTDDHQMISDGDKLLFLFEDNKIHEHPLFLHDHPAAAADVARICNDCIQLISPSDPFYSCCAHLPAKLITQHPQIKGYSLTLLSYQRHTLPSICSGAGGCQR